MVNCYNDGNNLRIKWLYGNYDNDAYNDSDSDDGGDSDDDGDNDAAMIVTMMMETLFESANAQLYTVGNAHTVQKLLGLIQPFRRGWPNPKISVSSPSSWAGAAAARMVLSASFLHPAVKQGDPYRRQAPRLPQSP